MFAIYSGPSYNFPQPREAKRLFTRHRSPDGTSCDRTHPVPPMNRRRLVCEAARRDARSNVL